MLEICHLFSWICFLSHRYIEHLMRKIHKCKIIEKMSLVELPPIDKCITVVDMGFIWRLSTPSTEDREKPDGTDYTWKDYVLKVFELVIKRHQSAVTIIFVNDPYDLEVSIKDSEHERRASDVRYTCGSKNIFIKKAVLGSVAGSIEVRDLLKSVGSSVPAT